ncbi:MAG TPA: MFS transporter, partial [Pseudonocardiaceae bacterium]
PPSTPNELRVAAAFAEVLPDDVTVASVDDDFFALGGDSFSAVRTVRRIDAGLSVIELFQRPTVGELAALLDAREGGTADQGTGLLHRLTRGRRAAELTVVCVPYGGGSPITFQPLADALPEHVALYAIGLPGHDTARPDEELVALDEVADRVTAEVVAGISGPVLLYGHCLGGALATALAARLEAAGVPLRGVALGGTFPAAGLPGRFFGWLNRLLPADRMLSNRSYLDFLRAMGGFTDAYDEAERELLVRALRHDVRQAEHFYTRAYEPDADVRFAAPVLCVVGEKDRATELYQERYAEWGHFSPDVRLAVIPRAGHYFLKHQAAELAGILASWAGGAPPPTVTAPPVPTGGSGGPGGPSIRTFAAVALGQFVSMIGTGLSAFALGVWVFQRTGSAVDFALIAMLAALPAIILSPLAGAVADRFDRRRVMIIADTTAAVGTVALATLLWRGDLDLWHIYLFSALGAVCNAFQRPAYLAAIAQLVPKRYLGQANGIAQAGAAAGDLLAALAGGVLVGLVGLRGVVIIDMATFLVGVSVLLLVRFPNLLFVRREEPLLREVVTGWRYIVRRPSLVAMVVFFVVFNYLFAFATVLVTPLVLARHSAAVLGVVSAVGGVGGVVGVLAMALWGGTHRRAIGMVGFTSVVGLATVVMGLGAHPAFAAAGLFGLWAALMILNSHWMALIQTKVGMELQGRVLATNQMLAMSMMPLGFLSAGPLADAVFEPWMRADGPLAGTVGAVLGTGPGRGTGFLLVCVGGVLLVWGLLGLAYRPLRLMEDLLPDALPEAEIADKDTLQQQADRALAPAA